MLSAGRIIQDLFTVLIFWEIYLSLAQWKHLEDDYETTERQC